MIISTVTLNPAIDRTYYVKSFALNSVNRAVKVRNDVGGKGINVSGIASICGFKSIATGFVSGANGRYIEDSLRQMDVTTDFVHTMGETRVNTKIVDLENKNYTDINESGPAVTDTDIAELLKKCSKIAKESDVFYVGGSYPPNITPDIYRKLIKIGKDSNAITVLDADGEAFMEGLKAGPDIIKPNQTELETLIGRKIKSVAEAVQATVEIVEKGIGTVLLTLGGNGAIAAGKSGVYRAYPAKVDVKSTVGAGDSFLCGYIYGLSESRSMDNCLKYASSFAAAKIAREGTELPDIDSFKEAFQNIIIEKIG